MANTYKNEKDITINGVTITLRPSFENMANMESKLGSIAYVAYKFSQFATNMKNLPGLSELTTVVYYMQAAHDKESGKTLLSIEEVYELIAAEGVFKMISPILEFLSQCTAGNKAAPSVSESVKKN